MNDFENRIEKFLGENVQQNTYMKYDCEEDVNEIEDLSEFKVKLSEFIGLTKCGHTDQNGNTTKIYASEINEWYCPLCRQIV